MNTSRAHGAIAFWVGVLIVLAIAVVSMMPRAASAATITLTSATSSSSNASSTLAKVGDTITFGLHLSGTPSATSTPVINILSMGSTSMTGSGAWWSYSTTTTSNWTEGLISFMMGWGGSVGEATTTITQSSITPPNVRFDKTPPTVTSVSVTSSNASSTLAKPGDVLTLSFTTSEGIQAPSYVTIYGNNATFLPTSSADTSWTASSSVITGNTSGLINFFIDLPTDWAGNATSSAFGPGSGGSFNIPQTSNNSITAYDAVPSITIAGSNPDSAYANISTSYSDPGASATDALGNSVSVSTTGSVNEALGGSYTLTYNATDAAGNSNSASRTVNVVAPGSGGIISGGGGGGGGGSSVAVALPNNGATVTTTTNSSSSSGNSTTVAQLQAELNSLLAQIAALGGSVSMSAGSFTRDLTLGSIGSDVKALQQWLNGNGYPLASSGPGSSGNETTRFGALTKAALAKFQAAVGISPTAGYFGPKTRAYIAAHP